MHVILRFRRSDLRFCIIMKFMAGNLRWDDLHYLLEAHRQGSLLGAARALGTHPSTVGRRIEALEEELGAALFDRTTTGLAPTALADALRPVAETMEQQAADALRLLEQRETEPEGLVRITAPPGVATYFLAPFVAEIRARYPRITVELRPSIGYADLTRREADLALRSMAPAAGDLVTVRLLEEPATPYVSAALDQRLGRIRALEDVAWMTWDESLAHLPDAVWLRTHAPEAPIALRCGTFEPLAEAARAGLGALFVGDRFGQQLGLVPLRMTKKLAAGLAPYPKGALHLVGHRALRDVPRVAAVWQLLVDRFR